MADAILLNRKNQSVTEHSRNVTKTINDTLFEYKEYYYLDNEVDENTGSITNDLVPHYTKDQVKRNTRSMRNAYMIAKGAVDPKDIVQFRNKYGIAASAMSAVLGFSKNTISNIEKDGVTSLPTGRFIKLCISNQGIFSKYLQTVSTHEVPKKEEILRKLCVK